MFSNPHYLEIAKQASAENDKLTAKPEIKAMDLKPGDISSTGLTVQVVNVFAESVQIIWRDKKGRSPCSFHTHFETFENVKRTTI